MNLMGQFKYLLSLIVAALLVWSLAGSSIRFKDGPMMQEHHFEPNANAGPLTVHLIPHSHDDVGWLKTVDGYFYGDDQDTQWAAVQFTIDSVVQELGRNPNYKFVIVEMAFLWRWWRSADQDQRSTLKRLITQKQVEIINGGWCMSDQATVYYEDWIDQMTLGLRWAKNTFGVVPEVAWHIDPFGHQSSSASLFSRMGFNSFFFARIDYQDKNLRLKNKGLEMIWRPTQYSPDPSIYIFTHVNYYHYSPPPGFCFDVRCSSEPIHDDPILEGYNLDSKARVLVDYFKSMALHFRSDNLLHTLGEDFHYANARMWFKNMDKLLKYINDRPELGVTLKYSTVTDYVSAINTQNNSYPSKSDDFYPYADELNAYWTGYFSSRPAVKGFVRDLSRWLQSTRKHLAELRLTNFTSTVMNRGDQIEEKLWLLQAAMGVLQHHDAVAGTEKQKVANDYVFSACKALGSLQAIYSEIKKQQIMGLLGQQVQVNNFHFNMFWNETGANTGLSAMLLSGQPVLISLYNPGSKDTYQIKLAVPNVDINVFAEDNSLISGDVHCSNPYDVLSCELIFPMEFEESTTRHVKLIAAGSGSAKMIITKELTVADAVKTFKLTDTDSVKITRSGFRFDLSLSGVVETFTVGYNYYESYQASGQKGGAYIFRPGNNNPKPFSTIKKIYYTEGSQMVVFFLDGDNTSTKVYFSKQNDYAKTYGVEVETAIGSIPVLDRIGKEVTINIKTNYANKKTFYTDSNGLEELKRVLDFRPSWNLNVHEPVAGNYYPINSHIGIIDDISKRRMSVLTDRSQGGSVIQEGQIELLVHRRLLFDDARGVDEPLNQKNDLGEGLKQKVRHYIVFGSTNNLRLLQKRNDQKITPLIVGTSSAKFTPGKQAIRPVAWSVPKETKLYLRYDNDGSYLVRMHNMMENKEALITIPNGWSLQELTLGANQARDDWKKKQLKWKEESQIKTSYSNQNYTSPFTINVAETTVKLVPFELKAFKLNPPTSVVQPVEQ